MRFRRFVVDGSSMLPTLQPGDYVVGRRTGYIAPGEIVAFPHPHRTDFWLIKRVVAVSGVVDLDQGTIDGQLYDDPHREPLVEAGRYEIDPGTMFVLSDNRRSTRADSRVFGPVEITNTYRIRFRYWPRPAVFG